MTVHDRLGNPDMETEIGYTSPHPTAFAVAWVDGPDAQPIVGISYRCDYRAEEEFGVGSLRKALCGPIERNFDAVPTSRDHTVTFADVNAIAITSRPHRLADPVNWGDPLPGYGSEYAATFHRSVSYTRGYRHTGDLSWSTVPELRAYAKSLGITPLPTRKPDLVNVIEGHPQRAEGAATPNMWPGWFQDGQSLILRADQGPTATVIEALAEAIAAGTLACGDLGGPFHTGTFIYDSRDLGPLLRQDITERFDLHDAQMARIAPVRASLEEDAALKIRFLGNPMVLDNNDGAGKALRFWLNATYQAGYREWLNLNGWYTPEQLADRKFLADAQARAEARTA